MSRTYSQAHCLKCICLNKNCFDASVQDLKNVLTYQKYPPRPIDYAIYKARMLNRTDLLEDCPQQSDTQRTSLWITYCTTRPNVNNILRRHFNMLEQSDRLKCAFPSPQGVIYRQSRNIIQTLVNDRFNSSP